MTGLEKMVAYIFVLQGFFVTTMAFCEEPALHHSMTNSTYHELESTLSARLAELLAASEQAWAAYLEQESKSLAYINRSMVLESGCIDGAHSGNPYRAILASLHEWRNEELKRFREKALFPGKLGADVAIEEPKAAIEGLRGDVIYYLPESYRKYAYMSQKAWEVFFASNSAFLEQFYSDERAIGAERRRMLHERHRVLSCQLQALRVLRTEYEE
jgi:hypothetical protein